MAITTELKIVFTGFKLSRKSRILSKFWLEKVEKVNFQPWVRLEIRVPNSTHSFMIFAGAEVEHEFRNWWQKSAGMEH
jgi:hypothetical protein